MIKLVTVTEEDRCPICGLGCGDYPNCPYGRKRGEDYDDYEG